MNLEMITATTNTLTAALERDLKAEDLIKPCADLRPKIQAYLRDIAVWFQTGTVK